MEGCSRAAVADAELMKLCACVAMVLAGLGTAGLEGYVCRGGYWLLGMVYNVIRHVCIQVW